MPTRKFNSPNIEYNEIDMSDYTDTSSIAVNTRPLIMGFTDRGNDYILTSPRTLNRFVQLFGTPTNEAERYLYQAVRESYTTGARPIVAKIPYSNDSKDRYSCTVYTSDGIIKDLTSPNNEEFLKQEVALSAVVNADSDIRTALCISSLKNEELSSYLYRNIFKSGDRFRNDNNSTLISLDEYDALLVNDINVEENSILIVNTTRNQYEQDAKSINIADESKGETSKFMGIVPVIVSPDIAYFFQTHIDSSSDNFTPEQINAVCNLQTIDPSVKISNRSIDENFVLPVSASNTSSSSISKEAVSYFPYITQRTSDHLDQEYLTQIGIVVFKMIRDDEFNGKISFKVVETFVGSLSKTAKDPSTNTSIFIDTVVNRSSSYINLFSNFKQSLLKNVNIIHCSNQVATVMGFTEKQCKKNLTSESILSSVNTILNRASNTTSISIDIICDAGLSTIYQNIFSQEQLNQTNGEIYFDILKIREQINNDNVSAWKLIIEKFSDFAKNKRQDCIFIADAYRNFCLTGNEKIVRFTKPTSSVKKDILPYVKYMLINSTSYTAGYCDWFRCPDQTTQEDFWCPPSVKALGVYLYTDRYYNQWTAPAGINRGIIDDATDIAFNPTVEEAETLYENGWNYAMSFPLTGIVLEGQKTFLTKPTALDRVNVRRLCLYIKRQIRNTARQFVYEKITARTLNSFHDEIYTVLYNIQLENGISEFYVKADFENNTQTTIDRNEIHATIAIRPVKTAEFIIINSVVANQTAVLTEIISGL